MYKFWAYQKPDGKERATLLHQIVTQSASLVVIDNGGQSGVAFIANHHIANGVLGYTTPSMID